MAVARKWFTRDRATALHVKPMDRDEVSELSGDTVGAGGHARGGGLDGAVLKPSIDIAMLTPDGKMRTLESQLRGPSRFPEFIAVPSGVDLLLLVIGLALKISLCLSLTLLGLLLGELGTVELCPQGSKHLPHGLRLGRDGHRTGHLAEISCEGTKDRICVIGRPEVRAPGVADREFVEAQHVHHANLDTRTGHASGHASRGAVCEAWESVSGFRD